MSDLIKSDITNEIWREYDFGGRVYRIENPISLYRRPGGMTHRVTSYVGATDTIVAHCVPAPGVDGCVLRWTSKDGSDAVTF